MGTIYRPISVTYRFEVNATFKTIGLRKDEKDGIFDQEKVLEDQEEKLIEVTGEEFYKRVKSLEGEKRYFIRLADDITYEDAEIVIETSQDDYQKWRKEYDAHRYLSSIGNELITISLDSWELSGSQRLLDSASDENNPETRLIRKEQYRRLRNALMQLTPEERRLIDRLYLTEDPCTEQELAEELHITQQAGSKRKKKILEKMENFNCKIRHFFTIHIVN